MQGFQKKHDSFWWDLYSFDCQLNKTGIFAMAIVFHSILDLMLAYNMSQLDQEMVRTNLAFLTLFGNNQP